jgi:hypothetical protein
MAHGERAET